MDFTTKRNPEAKISYQTEHFQGTLCQQNSYRGSAGAKKETLHFLSGSQSSLVLQKRVLFFWWTYLSIPTLFFSLPCFKNPVWKILTLVHRETTSSPTIYPPATQPVLSHSTESPEHTVLISMSAYLAGAFYSHLPQPHKKERSEQTRILYPRQYTRANKNVLWKLWLAVSRPCLDGSLTILWTGIHTEGQNKITPEQ